jgi:hypothetical protein
MRFAQLYFEHDIPRFREDMLGRGYETNVRRVKIILFRILSIFA